MPVDRRLVFNVDWVMLGAALLLCGVGVLTILSATQTGRHAGLHERADRAVSELENLSLARYIDPLAWAAATSHDPEANHEWLRRAFDEHVGALPLLNAEPLMDALRSVPAYRALFDRLGLPRVERSAP